MSAKSVDLVSMICLGQGRKFRGIPCENYLRACGECAILKGKRMAEMVESVRCTWEMLDSTISKFAVRGICDEGADLDFGRLLLHFRIADLHDTRPVSWFRYVERATMRACLEILRKRGDLNRNRCGYCVQLTASSPHYCVTKGIGRKKTDLACEDYAPVKTGPISTGSGTDNAADSVTDESMWDAVTARIDVEAVRRGLLKRALSAKAHSKGREKFLRQYDIFVQLLHSFRDGLSREESLSVIEDALP